MNRIDKEKKFWDDSAKFYENNVTKHYPEIIEKIVSLINNDNLILDIACGTGIISRSISSKAKQIYGIDISSNMLEIAKEKANENNISNIIFENEDAYSTHFEDNYFDKIICVNLLHMIKEPDKVLSEIYRLLKTDGEAIIAAYCYKESTTVFNRILFSFFILLNLIGIVPYLNRFSKDALLGLITKNNFKIKHSELFQGKSKGCLLVLVTK